MSAKTLRNRRKRLARKARQNAVPSQLLPGIGYNTNRSRTAPSNADPRTFNLLNSLGNTIDGRAACMKILHPCMETGNHVTKFPDGAVSTSVVLERRDEYMIPPAVAPEGAEKYPWSCLIFHLPFAMCRTVVCRYAAELPVSEKKVETALAGMVANFLDANNSSAYIYPAWNTYDIGVTAPNNSQWSVLTSDTVTPELLHKTGSETLRSIRRTCMGVTVDLDAPALANQGRVLTGQWAPDVALSTLQFEKANAIEIRDIYTIDDPAWTTNSIVSSDEFCRQAQAKTGSYTPIRPVGLDVPFTPVTEKRMISTRSNVANINFDDVEAFGDLWLRGWCVAVEAWSGMDMTASLRMKIREDLEIVAAPKSPYSPFATPALPDDLRARTMIQEFSRTQPHSYPAEDNEYGKLVPKIVSGIAGALSNLGIPVVSPVASVVGTIADSTFGKMVGDWLDKLF